ncbi:DUF559 domain-containing protein [bacterium]|nr:MAG: DUF559 domain-containing protein [bacterium]
MACATHGRGVGGEGPDMMSPMPRTHRDSTKVERARKLRKEPSVAEIHLWEVLRNSRVGFKFRRQEPIAGVVVDFYCDEAKLVVEADGEQHAQSVSYDEARDKKLADLGIEALRIPNVELYSPEKHRYEIWVRRIVAACERRSGRAAFPNVPRMKEG